MQNPARPALSAQRALAVLDLLTANPGVRYTLSDLAKALSVAPSSLHAVLGALLSAGFVARHPRSKTYALGPAAITMGHAASHQNQVVELAVAEMTRLAEDGFPAVATTRIGSEILCVAAAGQPDPGVNDLEPGQRVPLVLPIGQVQIAWMDAASVVQWLSTFDEGFRLGARSWVNRVRRVVRARGYAATRVNDAKLRRDEAIAALLSRPADPTSRKRLISEAESSLSGCVLDLDVRSETGIANITAPVFDEYGRVSLAIGVYGPKGSEWDALEAAIARLLDTTRGLTVATGGRPPSRDPHPSGKSQGEK